MGKAARYMAVLVLAVGPVMAPMNAQRAIEGPSATRTPLPDHTGCFELFLSPRQMRETYLLNACTGASWVRADGAERSGWLAIPREDNPADTETLSAAKHFQIVSSVLTAQDTFLLNALNGATWRLYEGADGGLFWGAMVMDDSAATNAAGRDD